MPKFDDEGYRHDTNGVEKLLEAVQGFSARHPYSDQQDYAGYLNEFTFRQNHREMGNAMFDVLIAAV